MRKNVNVYFVKVGGGEEKKNAGNWLVALKIKKKKTKEARTLSFF